MLVPHRQRTQPKGAARVELRQPTRQEYWERRKAEQTRRLRFKDEVKVVAVSDEEERRKKHACRTVTVSGGGHVRM